MSDLPYNICINIIGGIISAILVLWVSGRWKARLDLRWQMIRLRNLLYNAEVGLDPTFHRKTFRSTGERIVEPSVEAMEWTSWHDQCVEIQYALFEIAERVTLECGVRESCFRRPRELDLAHFQKIGSEFADSYPTTYLGVIECVTETRNLLTEARGKAEKLSRHAAEYREHLEHPKVGVSMMNTDYFEKELEEVRQRIKLHREHVERLIPGKAIHIGD